MFNIYNKIIWERRSNIRMVNSTIIWQPELCQHAGICVKTLPDVYKPKERPWIQIENATTAELIAQIKQCPSGADIPNE